MLFSINVRPDSGVERWTHNFDGHVLRSTLRYDPLRDLVLVRFGPGICGAVVRRKGRELVVDVADMWVLGVPLPKALIPRSASREWQDDYKGFCFDISASLSKSGLLVRYEGYVALEA